MMKRILFFVAALLLVTNGAWAQKVAYVWGLTNDNTGEMEKAQTFFDQYFVNESFETCPRSVGKFLDMNEFINNIDGKMDDVSVVWLNVDRPANSYSDNVALYNNPAFVEALTNFVKGGGSLLLTKEAVPMINLMGRMCEPSEKGHGGFTNSGGALKQWVINANLGGSFDRRSHPVYDGIGTAKTDGLDDGAEGFAFESTTSWFTDINTGWNDLLPKGEGVNASSTEDANFDPNKLRNVERSGNCIDLGTWGHIGDYFGAFIVEFLPGLFNGEDWKGTVIICGPAAYQWVNENAFLDNVKLFTKNAVNYLLTKPATMADVTFSPAAEIGTSRYASTFYADQSALIPSGVTAYTASVNTNTLSLTKVSGNVIPANTGVLLVGNEAKTFQFQFYPVPAESLGENAFAGTTTDQSGSQLKAAYDGQTLYVLSKSNTVPLGFHKLGDSSTVAAGKAFLVVESTGDAKEVPSFTINIDADDNITAIDIMHNGPSSLISLPSSVYDLQGRKVATNPSSLISHPSSQKGVYIVNGKKVIIK